MIKITGDMCEFSNVTDKINVFATDEELLKDVYNEFTKVFFPESHELLGKYDEELGDLTVGDLKRENLNIRRKFKLSKYTFFDLYSELTIDSRICQILRNLDNVGRIPFWVIMFNYEFKLRYYHIDEYNKLIKGE